MGKRGGGLQIFKKTDEAGGSGGTQSGEGEKDCPQEALEKKPEGKKVKKKESEGGMQGMAVELPKKLLAGDESRRFAWKE